MSAVPLKYDRADLVDTPQIFSAVAIVDAGTGRIELPNEVAFFRNTFRLNTQADGLGLDVTGFLFLEEVVSLTNFWGRPAYRKIQITDAAYQTGTIYAFGDIAGSVIGAADINRLNDALALHSNVDTPGILIPLYIYPTGGGIQADYARVISVARKYPASNIYTVVNPANGPGAVVDGNYTDAIKKLRAAGVRVLGYVSTDYPTVAGHGTKTKQDVMDDVDAWMTLYPDIDGMFYDEMSYTSPLNATVRDFYETVTRHAHNRGLFPVVANPGVAVPADYYEADLADVVVIHETGAWPTEAALRDYSYNTDYSKSKRAVLVYGSGLLSEADFLMCLQYAGMVFCNDDAGAVMPGPWNVLTTLLEEQARMTSGGNIANNGWTYPIGSYYVQFPDASSNTEETEFPTTQRPATLFGGTWAEQWADESVYFRTRGALSDTDRTEGLQSDQMQRITGSITSGKGVGTADGPATRTGAFSSTTPTTNNTYSGGGSTGVQIEFDSGKSPNARVSSTTDGETRVVNRRIKVWKRTA